MKASKLKNNVADYLVWIIVVVEFIFFGLLSDTFLSLSNVMTAFRQVALITIMAMGTAFVMISGNIDLSIGSIVSVCSTAGAMLNLAGVPVVLCIILTVVLGIIIGLVNGILVVKVQIPAMIATLGTMMVFNGVALLLSGGLPVFGISEAWKPIEKTMLFGFLPISIIYMLAFVVIAWFILEKTYFGRYVYAIGSNDEAAYLSGIKVNRTRILTYIISGATAAIAAVVYISRLNSGQPQGGVDMEMDILTALVVAGVSLSGGKGKVVNALGGALIVGVLRNGLVSINVTEFYQQIIKGLVLIFAVGVDSLRNAKKYKA